MKLITEHFRVGDLFATVGWGIYLRDVEELLLLKTQYSCIKLSNKDMTQKNEIQNIDKTRRKYETNK